LEIINALNSKKYEFRTISGIAQDVNQTQETVKRILLSLVSDGVVTKVGSGRRVLWALKGKGQN